MKLASLLRSRLEELDMSITVFADKVGTRYQNAYSWLRDSIPEDDTVQVICDVISIKMKDMVAAIDETKAERRAAGKRDIELWHEEIINALDNFGCCPCLNSTMSNRDTLLGVCRHQLKSGNPKCKRCETIPSGGEITHESIKIGFD